MRDTPRRETMTIWCVDHFVDLLTMKSYESKCLGILLVLCCCVTWGNSKWFGIGRKCVVEREIVIGKKRVVAKREKRETLWILPSEFLVVPCVWDDQVLTLPRGNLRWRERDLEISSSSWWDRQAAEAIILPYWWDRQAHCMYPCLKREFFRLMRQTGLLHVSMLDAILPLRFPLRMKVIVFGGYRENNKYRSRAFVSWIKFCSPWSSII